MNFRYTQGLLKQIYTLTSTLIFLAIITEKLEAQPITITLNQNPTKTHLIITPENVMFQKSPEASTLAENTNSQPPSYTTTPEHTETNPLHKSDPLYPLAEILMTEKQEIRLKPENSPNITIVFQKKTLKHIKKVADLLIDTRSISGFSQLDLSNHYGIKLDIPVSNGPYTTVKCKSIYRLQPDQKNVVMTVDIIQMKLVNDKITEEQLLGQTEYFYQGPQLTLHKINIKSIHTQASNAKANRRGTLAAVLGGTCGALVGHAIAKTQHEEPFRGEFRSLYDESIGINALITWCCTTLGIAAGAGLGYVLERGINFVNRGRATTQTAKQVIKNRSASSTDPSESTVMQQPTLSVGTGLRERKL